MPFLRFSTRKQQNSTAHSLRSNLDTFQRGHNILLQPLKRASFFISRRRLPECKASMTLEAAIALPLFLFAVINVLFLVNVIALQSRLSAALHQTGNEMAFRAYTYDNISEGYARKGVIDYVGRDYLGKSCVVDGEGGISAGGTSLMGAGDVIDIRISYRVKPFSGIMGFEGFSMMQRYYGKAWTGYDVGQFVSDESADDPMVYITQTGTVYHISRNCTYLNPSVEAVSASELVRRRNQSGGKYSACEICGSQKIQGTVYITSQGSSYHSRLNCPGLKRTIYTVPLSQTGGRGRCSKCG